MENVDPRHVKLCSSGTTVAIMLLFTGLPPGFTVDSDLFRDTLTLAPPPMCLVVKETLSH